MANPSLRLHKAARRLGSRKRIISMPYRVDIPEGIEALDHILNHLGTNKLVESRKRMFRIIYDAPETSLSPREREAMRFPMTAMMGCPICNSMRSEEHTSAPVTNAHLVCRLLLAKKKPKRTPIDN